MSKRDYYDILGVGKGASDPEIKSAYRKLALKYHPDRNPGDKAAEEQFKEAAEAYSVLADGDKRQRYDAYGHAGLGGAAGFGGAGFDPTVFADFSDILGDFFGFGRRTRGPRRGADLRYDLELSFEEAAFGAETELQIPRTDACADCGGTGAAPGTKPTGCPACGGAGQVRARRGRMIFTRPCRACGATGVLAQRPCERCAGEGRSMQSEWAEVQVPAGIRDGARIRLPGQGNAGRRGGPAGDFSLVIHVEPHPLYRRQDDDLHCEVPVTMTEAALGAHVEVPTPDGPVVIEMPAGTQTGQRFRLRKRGMRRPDGQGRGDLYVEARVLVPAVSDDESRELLREFERRNRQDPRRDLGAAPRERKAR